MQQKTLTTLTLFSDKMTNKKMITVQRFVMLGSIATDRNWVRDCACARKHYQPTRTQCTAIKLRCAVKQTIVSDWELPSSKRQYTMRIYVLTVLSALLVLCVAKNAPSFHQEITESKFTLKLQIAQLALLFFHAQLKSFKRFILKYSTRRGLLET